ncbi:hypothetical protein KL942_002827 [Ogataea angusta]|uniref:Vacuolar protein sorting-associated protein 8 central domain-containing protein n=1 Tax=Pichia angusta TaxID=870730 RepID=A0ABQ7RSX9_PICAN|nr:hypothetical protein KL942_002827 [Ogataea angusta]KAG7846687.1 hypothetical protein KL940_004285 [Ogataea angusta]
MPARFNFDQRLRSRVARNGGSTTAGRELEPLERSRSPSPYGSPSDRDAIQLITLKKITARLFENLQQLEQQGEPVCLAVCAKYIGFGTAKGHVLVFSYDQSLEAAFFTGVPITAISFSLDSSSLAVGHRTGRVSTYELSNQDKPSHNFDSLNCPISTLSFVGKRHSALLSTTDDGRLVYHHATRTLFGFSCSSRTLAENILASSQLLIGPVAYPTDTMGVLALMTPSGLTVLSTDPVLQTHFRVGKPKIVAETDTFGCAQWFPATKVSPALAYSWGNVLTLIDVVADKIVDERKSESVLLRYENKRRYPCQEPIVAIHWLNSKVLVVLTVSQRLFCLSRENLQVLTEQDVMNKHVKHRLANSQHRSFAATSAVFRGKLFILGKYQTFLGSPRNWADELFELLQSGQYISALETARVQYDGQCDLVLIGLPKDDDERHQKMRHHIIQMLDASAKYIFTDQSVLAMEPLARKDVLAQFLATAFRVCVSLKPDPAVYEQLFDTYVANGLEDVYFGILEKFIRKEEITVLPPVVLRKMVARYVYDGRGHILEELVCFLDLKQLDIDLAITLCRENHLNDSLAYIWNTMLEDYITPLMDALKALKKHSHEPAYYEADYVYAYISYILTGRQYPTEKPINYRTSESAKKNIYYVLFSGAAVSWPRGAPKFHIVDDENIVDEPAFPYLFLLLKHDGALFFRCLNEVFEDTFLNDNEVFGFSSNSDTYELKVSRQYILDVLMGIFGENELGKEYKTYLAIFIARNYPKYLQFIRLSNSLLDSIIRDLCAYPVPELKEDCELSLQSLLSVHKPSTSLVPLLESAGFYNALVSIYQSEQRALKLLELWIEQKNRPEATEIIERCFRLVRENPGERLDVEQFLERHFADFCTDPAAVAPIFSEHCQKLNSRALELDQPRKYKYLKAVFDLRSQRGLEVSPEMELAYAECLLQYEPASLRQFVLGCKMNEKLMHFLKKNQQFETVVEIHRRANETEQAVEDVIEALIHCATHLKNTDNSDILWRYLYLGFDVIKGSQLTRDPSQDLQPDEKLYLRLVETAVGFFVAAEGPLLDSFKRLVQDAFTTLINIKRDHSDSFSRIFNTFLTRSSAQLTTLQEVRPVLDEIFQAYSHQEVIYEIILRLVNNDIFQELMVLQAKRETGWSLANLECEVCGKPIWGSKVSAQVFDAWQECRMQGVVRASIDADIMVFQCRHGYHTRCLHNMGVEKECILCRDK